jgi:Protein of unknown function (DUF3117)
MGAMKPRTGAGPIEAEKEKGHVVIRVPMDDGERLVVALDAQEAMELGRLLVEPGPAE